MKSELRQIISRGLDQHLAAFRAATDVAQLPALGWLRAVREAVGLQQGIVAEKIGVTRQSYAELETAETREAISLKSLKRAAAAMDCDLVYFLVPRESVAKTFEALSEHHDPAGKQRRADVHAVASDDDVLDDPLPHLSER